LPFDPRAEVLFFEFQDRVRRGEGVDFEDLCRAHPEHAAQLREMRALEDFTLAIAPPLVDDTLTGRLKERYGDDVDLGVSLGGEPQADSGPQSKLFERLRAEGPRGTRYKLLGEVARGGMGAVLRIWDDDLRRTLAMKVVLGRDEQPTGETPAVDPKTIGRFLEEAQITGQLDHPSIVPVHELGLDATGRVYFTMKLVTGEDLRAVFEHVKSGHDDWNQVRALNVLLRVCEAMAFAHSKNVVHRDLKPANVMVGKFGEVYVMDWGLARVLEREDKHDLRLRPQGMSTPGLLKTERRDDRGGAPDSPLVTMDGDVVGTPSYMPPEQARGELKELGPHSDVYSLGAMLYELVTGQIPFVPDKAPVSPYAILMRLRDGPPRAAHELAPHAPAELLAIVEKAMAREISGRYPNTLELAKDLHAYESGAWAEARKWARRNKPLATSLAAAVLAVLIGGVAFAFKSKVATEQARRAEQGEKAAKSSAERAERGERAAQENAERAQRGEAAAQLARDEATQKANDVLSLSAVQDLQDLLDRADALWPAHPENLAGYESWLADARELVEGRPGDAKLVIKPKPSLEQHKTKLLELEALALPQTDEERTAELATHPRAKELVEARARLQWMQRMLGEDAWPSESEIEAQLAVEKLPTDADGLNNVAWPLVDPDKLVYGGEVLGLLLARRAVAATAEGQRHIPRDTLAWALFRTGQFDLAMAEERQALSEAPESSTSEYAGHVKKLEEAVSGWRGSDGSLLAAPREEATQVASEVTALEAEVNRRRTWSFANGEANWWHVQLTKLVTDLDLLRDPKTGLFSSGISEARGWGIVRRAEFARSIEERSVSGEDAKRRWSEAIGAIVSSPKYGGLTLTPQLGLLPISADPDSGLWEFAHLQTGDVAERGADGKLVLTDGIGLVFVLIPGGTFAMGAQSDPAEANFDPQAAGNESRVQDVALDAYFLSKYEMTQGQWERFVGRNPSQYRPGAKYGQQSVTLLDPVEQVSWNDCTQVLVRIGLELPTEAQWERAGRAGTSSVWWTGDEKETLAGSANLADAYSKSNGGPPSLPYEEWLSDGAVVHTRIGSYRANAYGLHDVVGNVWEWCRDGYGVYDQPVRAGDGERQVTDSLNRVYRGGSFGNTASDARSAYRRALTPELRSFIVGLRPVRASRLSPSPLHPSGE